MFGFLNFSLVASGLSCGTWDLSLQHAGSFVAVRGLLSSCGVRDFSSLVVACGLLSSCGVRVFSSLVVAYGFFLFSSVARRLQGAWAL